MKQFTNEFLFKEQVNEIVNSINELMRGVVNDDMDEIKASYDDVAENLYRLVSDIQNWETELDHRERKLELKLYYQLSKLQKETRDIFAETFEEFYK